MADGFTQAGLEALPAVAEQHVGDDLVPGVVALVARGEHVHVETLGRLDIGGRPVASVWQSPSQSSSSMSGRSQPPRRWV